MKAEKHRIRQNGGQRLLMLASMFGLPEKLGDTAYNVAERGIAAEEARALYRELKSRSPLFLKDPTKPLFGPGENWQPMADKDDYKLEDRHRLIEIRLSQDAHMGAFWCLLLALHPSSKLVGGVMDQEDIVWPLAADLRLTKMLRKTLKLDSADHKRLELDTDEPEPSQVEEEETLEPMPVEPAREEVEA